MLLADLLGLFYVAVLAGVGECLPLGAQLLAQLRVVHPGVLLRQLFAPLLRPHHEGVHGSLDVIRCSGHNGHRVNCKGREKEGERRARGVKVTGIFTLLA